MWLIREKEVDVRQTPLLRGKATISFHIGLCTFGLDGVSTNRESCSLASVLPYLHMS